MSEHREFSESDLKWVKRFQRVMKDAPKELFMFVGPSITIYPERVMQDTRDAAVVDIKDSFSIHTNMQFDGGDY